MQDQLQGAGGTINMNWWFTNHAIILDTAGRLMFEEVEAGAVGEWKEFMKLLKASRPNCPINGMILVIPVDSLIKDTADEIERKAGKIAQQLDTIQRTLGVRFPVFVVITKCDLINGFREFFDSIDDPQLQQQIFGWSNPAPLDSAFSPGQVEQHLEVIRQRILRHRLWLLRDPVHTEDPAGRRIEQVDAMYAFPDAMMRIVPRLRRYLEMVFVAGEWSPKPLFLRGIYFTSSLREGSALDADLAETLGVPPDSLPGGGVWERDRAFFLRDLFLEKMFREKGLVTQASNAKGQQRKRKLIVAAAALFAVLVCLALTIYFGMAYSGSLDAHVKFWRGAQAAFTRADNEHGFERDSDNIVERVGRQPEYEYKGGYDLADVLESKDAPQAFEPGITRADFPTVAATAIENETISASVPAILRPLSLLGPGLDTLRLNAYRSVLDEYYVRPLVAATAVRMGDDKQAWTGDHVEALEQLLLLRRYATGTPPVASDGDEPVTPSLVPLFKVSLSDFGDHDEKIREADAAIRRFYAADDTLPDAEDITWVEAARAANVEGQLDRAVEASLARHAGAWERFGEADPDTLLGRLFDLNNKLDRFEELEEAFLIVCRAKAGITLEDIDYPPTTTAAQIKAGQWHEAWMALRTAREELDAIVDRIYDDHDGQSIADICAVARAEVETKVKDEFDRLLEAATPENNMILDPVEGDALEPQREQLIAQRRDVLAKINDEQGSIARLATALEARQAGYLAEDEDRALYRIRCAQYDRAREAIGLTDDGTLATDTGTVSLEEVSARLDAIEAELNRTREAVRGRLAGIGAEAGAELRDRAERACLYSLELARRFRSTAVLRAVMDGRFSSWEQVAEEVERVAEGKEPRAYRRVALTALDADGAFRPTFHPEAAREALQSWNRLEEKLSSEAQPPLDVAELSSLFEQFESYGAEYVDRYAQYWGTTVLEAALPRPFSNWPSFHAETRNLMDQVRRVNGPLLEIHEHVQEALDMLDELDLEPSAATADDVKRRRAVVKRAIDDLRTGKFDEDCSEVLRFWERLTDDTGTARASLCRASDDRLRSYVRIYCDLDHDFGGDAAVPPPGVPYWSTFLLEGARQLANSEGQYAEQCLQRLMNDWKAFPICRDAGIALPAGQLPELRACVEAISSAQQAPGGDGARRTLAAHQRGMERIFNRLCGEGLLEARDEAWVASLRGLIDAIAGADERAAALTCEVIHLGPAANNDRRIAGLTAYHANYEELTIPGCTSGPVEIRSRESAGSVCRFEVAGRSVDLVFRDPTRNKDVTVNWGGPWNVMRALLDERAERLDDGARWIVPVEIPDDGGARYIWFELKFSRPLPSLDRWPDSAQWPG